MVWCMCVYGVSKEAKKSVVVCVGVRDKESAPSGNRTRGISMATRYFTTKPTALGEHLPHANTYTNPATNNTYNKQQKQHNTPTNTYPQTTPNTTQHTNKHPPQRNNNNNTRTANTHQPRAIKTRCNAIATRSALTAFNALLPYNRHCAAHHDLSLPPSLLPSSSNTQTKPTKPTKPTQPTQPTDRSVWTRPAALPHTTRRANERANQDTIRFVRWRACPRTPGLRWSVLVWICLVSADFGCFAVPCSYGPGCVQSPLFLLPVPGFVDSSVVAS